MTKGKQGSRNFSTRSKRFAQSTRQGALSADSNPTPNQRSLQNTRSQQCVERCPSEDQNNSPAGQEPHVSLANADQPGTTTARTHISLVSNPGMPINQHCNVLNQIPAPEGILGTSLQVGDNREVPINVEQDNSPARDFSASKPSDPWFDTFSELRALRSRMEKIDTRMNKLDSIEESTSSLSNQVLAVVQKTSEIEAKVSSNTAKVSSNAAKVDSNAAKISDLNKEVSSLKELVAKQSRTISDLSKVNEDITRNNKRTVAEMNDLVGKQKEQVDKFQSTAKRMKSDIKSDILHQMKDTTKQIESDIRADIKVDVTHQVEDKMSAFSQELSYKSLKDQAFQNRHNLVFIGLNEDSSKSTQKIVSDFLKTNLKIEDVEMGTAYRIGATPGENPRPILAKFPKLPHRNKIWKKRMEISEEEGASTIRIQADLPKKLKEDIRVLYRVAKAASTLPEFQSATVRDYALVLDGNIYSPLDLESLPVPIRPSTLATRNSEEALVFFSRHSFLSNHFPSEFTLQGIKFSNVEQFLAYKRAITADRQPVISRAINAKNPAEAKFILNSLKDDHPLEWENNRGTWAAEALRAKFAQNPALARALHNTKTKHLGEASRDTVWGIGMDLEDPKVLDHSRWPEAGNLLGKTLMAIREEIASARMNSGN